MTQRLEFTPEIQAALQEERYHHPVPLVRRRMEALWLKSHGLPHRQIATLTGGSENTGFICIKRGRHETEIYAL